jgi:hypothetical protein
MFHMHHGEGPLPERLRKNLRPQTLSSGLTATQLVDVQQRSKRKAAAQLQQAGLPPSGTTGKFPRGKLTTNDAGQWHAAIGPDDTTQTVIVQFGKPMEWLGMTPAHAIALGRRLIECGEGLLNAED